MKLEEVNSILKDNYIMICDSSGIYNIFELKEDSSIGKIKHPNGTMTSEEMWNVLNKWIDKHEAGEVITNVEELL